jgi:hypothetical protein
VLLPPGIHGKHDDILSLFSSLFLFSLHPLLSLFLSLLSSSFTILDPILSALITFLPYALL